MIVRTLQEPELNHVTVHKISNGIMVCRDGHFWFKAEGGIGLFLKIDLPEVPDVSKMVKEKKV